MAKQDEPVGPIHGRANQSVENAFYLDLVGERTSGEEKDKGDNAMLNAIRRLVKEEEGASAAEYALLLVLITLGIVGAMTTLGGNITAAISNAAGCLTAGGCGGS